MKKQASSPSTSYGALVVAALLLAGAFWAPAAGVLTGQMVSALCLIAFAVVLWVKQPLPIAVTSLIVVILLPILGLSESLNTAFAGYSNPSNFFVIASFGVAIAIRKTSVSGRILKRMLAMSGGKANRIVLAFMLLTYLLSTIMSDIAAVMIALAFAEGLLEGIDDAEQKKRFGRLLLLSLPLASIIGGTATPAGSTVNVMALNILSANTGIEVSFLHWCLLGLPVSLVMIFAAWFVLTRFYRAPDLSQAQAGAFLQKMDAAPPLKSEKMILGIVVLMVVAWIAGSWISALNTTTVAIIGLALMLFPGIQAFTWKEFKAGVPWEIFLMGGATVSLGTVAQQTGLVALLADTVQRNFTSINGPVLIVILGVMVTLVLLVIPVGPATVSMLTMPIYAMVSAIGLDPVMAVVTLGIFASNSTILPLNAVVLLSYTRGYWKISELARVGIVITVIWIALAALWIPAITAVLA